MKSPKTTPANLLGSLKTDFKSYRFKTGENFLWSPKDKTIYYAADKLSYDQSKWALLHEVAHAQLEHNSYNSDLELLIYEALAWDQAKELAQNYSVEIDEEHIQTCLDTYRDWLYSRSTCPACQSNGLQTSSRYYQCLTCSEVWSVSTSRFCRPYRLRINKNTAEV